MKEKPIIFSPSMVNAILKGRKTQTRRVIKPSPKSFIFYDCRYDGQDNEDGVNEPNPHVHYFEEMRNDEENPYTENYYPIKCKYKVGDRLWVKEAFYYDFGEKVYFKADNEPLPVSECVIRKWKSPIYMARELSRITLEITSIKAERLQDISEEDAISEGIERLISGRGYYDPRYDYGAVHLGYFTKAKEAFEVLWDSLAKKGKLCNFYDWDSNPWVWAIGFRRIDK